LSPDKCVVTGHLGFIGSNLFRSLQAEGSNVHGIASDYLRDGDWRDSLKDRLERANPQVVFHVGACANTMSQDVQDMMIRNYEATKVVVDFCAPRGIPVVYSSSAANYGDTGAYPSNLYAWSKYAAEDYVVSHGEGIALRYFNVFGPGEEHKGTMASFVYQSFLNHQAGKAVKLFPGNPLRDFIYVEDIVAANLHAALHKSEFSGRVFEVGTGEANAFETMLEAFDIPFGYTQPDAVPAGYQFLTQSDKSKWLPGWSPKFSLDQGLAAYKAYLGVAS